MSAPLTQGSDPSTDDSEKAGLPPAGLPGYQTAAYGVPPPLQVNPEPEPRGRCCRRRRRLGHIFVALFVLWLAGRYLFRHCSMRRFGPHPAPSFWDPATEDFERPGCPHHNFDICVKSADWSEYSPDEEHPPYFDSWRKTELSLPSNSDDIFLLSKGLHANGVLRVIEAADREDIGVEVIVGFQENGDVFEETRLCTLRRGPNGHGVGIFTPKVKHLVQRRDELFFDITVSLPEGKDITTIPHFSTHLPLFAHFIERLPTHKFDSVAFHSAYSYIHIEDLVGDKISISSWGSPIDGTFNTTSSLDIKSHNSYVSAVVNAFNGDNASNDDNVFPTNVDIQTSNGHLYAELALISTHESKTGGVFCVHTETSNSPLAVNFTGQPPDAVLKLKAHTIDSPAYVRLQPSFEGNFKLRTSTLPAIVDVDDDDDDLEDPTDRGRKRVVHVNTVGRFSRAVDGAVVWIPQDERLAPAGEVDVSTSHSPLRLML